MTFALALRAIKAAITTVEHVPGRRASLDLQRSLAALESAQAALIAARNAARVTETARRHTAQCWDVLTDPGATCICRPPATREPKVTP
jgi:hypothetical protein